MAEDLAKIKCTGCNKTIAMSKEKPVVAATAQINWDLSIKCPWCNAFTGIALTGDTKRV